MPKHFGLPFTKVLGVVLVGVDLFHASLYLVPHLPKAFVAASGEVAGPEDHLEDFLWRRPLVGRS